MSLGDLVDISPLNEFANLERSHVYTHEDTYPVTSASHSAPNAVLAVDFLLVVDDELLAESLR